MRIFSSSVNDESLRIGSQVKTCTRLAQLSHDLANISLIHLFRQTGIQRNVEGEGPQTVNELKQHGLDSGVVFFLTVQTQGIIPGIAIDENIMPFAKVNKIGDSIGFEEVLVPDGTFTSSCNMTFEDCFDGRSGFGNDVCGVGDDH